MAVLKEAKFFLFRAARKDHHLEHFTTDDPTHAILVPFDGDPRERRGYVALPALIWASEKAGVR